MGGARSPISAPAAGCRGSCWPRRCPTRHVALVESQQRKCAFLDEGGCRDGLTNADVVCARAEEWSAAFGTCDVVTARALAAPAVLQRVRRARCSARARARRLERAVDDARGGERRPPRPRVLGLALETVRSVAPYRGSERRSLHVLRKIAPTPSHISAAARHGRKAAARDGKSR